MRVLLDTHVFLWWINADPRLSTHAREIITDGENMLFLSAVSGWEIAIKAKLGRLKLPGPLKTFIPEQMALNAIESLSVQMSHALHVHTLPLHHRDPFDRLLIAQAQLDNLPILTADSKIALYAIKIVW
jgi:PIN domain nuclease of toxin-antitoxin system